MKCFIKIGLFFSVCMCLFCPTPVLGRNAINEKDSVMFSGYRTLLVDSMELDDVGKLFLGLPYVSHALDSSETEELVVDFTGFDCTTFVENALSLYLTRKDGSFADFCNILQQVRYRDGKIDGYLSRYHYFSDWIYSKVNKGIIQLICPEEVATVLPLDLHYMSRHSDRYAPLRNDPFLLDSLVVLEKRISSHDLCYVSKERFKLLKPYLRRGDIVAFTTCIDGLDVQHVGILTMCDGDWYLLHAPRPGRVVDQSNQSVGAILTNNKFYSGLIVMRVLKR